MGLCAPLLSPQEGAAVVSGDPGEKAAAADPPFSCQMARSRSAELGRGSPSLATALRDHWSLHGLSRCRAGPGDCLARSRLLSPAAQPLSAGACRSHGSCWEDGWVQREAARRQRGLKHGSTVTSESAVPSCL